MVMGWLVVLGDVSDLDRIRMFINRRFCGTRVMLGSMVEVLVTFSDGWPSTLAVAVVLLVEQNPSEF